MNYLAHLYLADDSPESYIGNLMPDMVRGKLSADLPADVQTGITRHRRIDRITDTHPVVAQSKQRIFAHHGIFSGILIDVYYDHCLAVNWAEHHDLSLADFAGHVYRQMNQRPDLMPPPMREVICTMAREDWLTCYAHLDGMANTLHRMSARFHRRFKRTFDPDRAVKDLQEYGAGLHEDFNLFWPKLVETVGGVRGVCAVKVSRW